MDLEYDIQGNVKKIRLDKEEHECAKQLFEDQSRYSKKIGNGEKLFYKGIPVITTNCISGEK